MIERVARDIVVARFNGREAEAAVRAGARIPGRPSGLHFLTIRDARGRVASRVHAKNLVTTQGANYAIGAAMTGLAQLTAWYIGMVPANRTVTDGAMSSSVNPTQLSSATAAFVGGDVGRAVTVFGAGAAGAPLVTTIASIMSGTIAVLNLPALTTVSGAIASLGPIFVIGDTAASHAGWIENAGANVTNAVRPTWTPGSISAGAVDDSGSPAVYTMAPGLVGTVYIHGLFMISNNTIGGTAGTLYSEAAIAAGAQAVLANYSVSDVYQVSITPG